MCLLVSVVKVNRSVLASAEFGCANPCLKLFNHVSHFSRPEVGSPEHRAKPEMSAPPVTLLPRLHESFEGPVNEGGIRPQDSKSQSGCVEHQTIGNDVKSEPNSELKGSSKQGQMPPPNVVKRAVLGRSLSLPVNPNPTGLAIPPKPPADSTHPSCS